MLTFVNFDLKYVCKYDSDHKCEGNVPLDTNSILEQ